MRSFESKSDAFQQTSEKTAHQRRIPSLSSLRPPTIRLAIGTPTERAAHGIGKHPTGPTDGRDEAVYNVEIRNENSATRFANAVTRRSGRHKRKEAKTNL
ncbi:hypothetical protein OUZ56_004591 [Daphnia magna]|uniref:Uncharacterized protein n=1 Tax=Daphnia magna TaxID=35525 RepID=A0ABQ9YQ91_9CRUS|nr:hypothetical protein OUZ56_004591 [Daphnia magna]